MAPCFGVLQLSCRQLLGLLLTGDLGRSRFQPGNDDSGPNLVSGCEDPTDLAPHGYQGMPESPIPATIVNVPKLAFEQLAMQLPARVAPRMPETTTRSSDLREQPLTLGQRITSGAGSVTTEARPTSRQSENEADNSTGHNARRDLRPERNHRRESISLTVCNSEGRRHHRPPQTRDQRQPLDPKTIRPVAQPPRRALSTSSSSLDALQVAQRGQVP